MIVAEIVFRLDALLAWSVIATATWLAGWLAVTLRYCIKGTGPPFPGSAIPTVRALGLGIGIWLGLGIGLGLGLGLGGPWEWRTPGMADRNRIKTAKPI